MFQPPFQSGRTSPEVTQCRGDTAPAAGGIPEGSGSEENSTQASGAGDAAELDSLNGNSPADVAQAAARAVPGDPDSLSTHTIDSGFSELTSSSHDPPEEKETTCEKSLKPEGTTCRNWYSGGSGSSSSSRFKSMHVIADVTNRTKYLHTKGYK